MAVVVIAVAASGSWFLFHPGRADVGSHTRAAGALADVAALPQAPAPALRIGAPKPIAARRYLSTWTVIRRAAFAFARPDRNSRVVATLPLRAPEGTPNLVAVVARRIDDHGRVWVRVRVPALPNGTEGWIPRAALAGYEQVRTHLAVDTTRLTATLTRNGRVVFRARVGIGQTRWPTPHGQFTVRSRLTDYASPFYGPIAFGTTARSAVLTDWPAGGFIGIHGTDEPHLIPGRISHGCIRLRNDDLLRLARLMPVGTPLTIT